MTIYSETNVPILFRGPGERIGLSPEVYESVKAEHEEAQRALLRASQAVAAAGNDPDSEIYAKARDDQAAVIEKYLYIRESVVIDNPDEDRADYTFIGIGGSDVLEAVQECVGAFDLGHIGEEGVTQDHIFTPQYVASTSERLAEVLADYYSCPVRDLSEVLV